METKKVLTATAIEKMKRKAKEMRKALGIQHHAALDRVALDNGFPSWHAVTVEAAGIT